MINETPRSHKEDDRYVQKARGQKCGHSVTEHSYKNSEVGKEAKAVETQGAASRITDVLILTSL